VSTGAQAPDAAKAERARRAGERAATRAGETVRVPPKRVGILQPYGTNETTVAVQRAIERGARRIGWSTVVCDGQGDPVQWTNCAESLLNRDVDVLITSVVEPAIIRKQLARARREGVRTMSIGINVTPSPLFDVQYGVDEARLARVLNGYLTTQLPRRDSTAEVAAHTFPQVFTGRQRQTGLEALARGGVKVIDQHQTDLAKVAEDSRRAAETQVTANRDVDAIWVAPNFAFPHVAQVVRARYGGRAFPERPLVAGFIDDPINLDALRKGNGDALATHPYEPQGLIAIDQAAEHFARNRDFDPRAVADSRGVYGLAFFEPSLVTRENLPPEGQRFPHPEDADAFFAAKWGREFEGAR